MQLGPPIDQLGPTRRQASPQHPASRDLDDSLIVAVAGMEVGDAMVAHVHVDGLAGQVAEGEVDGLSLGGVNLRLRSQAARNYGVRKTFAGSRPVYLFQAASA